MLCKHNSPTRTYSRSDTQDKGWYHGKPRKKKPLAAGNAPRRGAWSGGGGSVGGDDDRRPVGGNRGAAHLGGPPGGSGCLLESQLGSLPEETVQGSLTGWNRLLVGQSALLSAGQDEVEGQIQGQQQEQQGSSDSSEPSTEPEEAPDDDDQVDTPLQPPVSQDGILEMTRCRKEGRAVPQSKWGVPL